MTGPVSQYLPSRRRKLNPPTGGVATRGEFGERLKGGVLENSINGDECSENSVEVARRLAGVTDRIGAVTEGSVPGTIDLPRSLNLGLSDLLD